MATMVSSSGMIPILLELGKAYTCIHFIQAEKTETERQAAVDFMKSAAITRHLIARPGLPRMIMDRALRKDILDLKSTMTALKSSYKAILRVE